MNRRLNDFATEVFPVCERPCLISKVVGQEMMLWDGWTTTKCVKMVVMGLDVSVCLPVSQVVTPNMPHTTSITVTNITLSHLDLRRHNIFTSMIVF